MYVTVRMWSNDVAISASTPPEAQQLPLPLRADGAARRKRTQTPPGLGVNSHSRVLAFARLPAERLGLHGSHARAPARVPPAGRARQEAPPTPAPRGPAPPRRWRLSTPRPCRWGTACSLPATLSRSCRAARARRGGGGRTLLRSSCRGKPHTRPHCARGAGRFWGLWGWGFGGFGGVIDRAGEGAICACWACIPEEGGVSSSLDSG